MARFSMSELTTYRWSFEEDVQHYAEAGFEAIAVWRQKLSDCGERRGRKLLAESDLQVSSLMWAGGFTGNEGRTYQESMQDAREAIHLAFELQAPTLLVHSGARGGHTHNHARRLLKNALQDLGPIAAEFGVCLALEPMPLETALGWTFLHSMEETLELLDVVASPAVRIALDCYHWGGEPRFLEKLPQWAPHLAVVHLADADQPPQSDPDRLPLGQGRLPLAKIVRTLQDADYRGFYEVELMGEEVEHLDYRQLLRQSQETLRTWEEA